MAEGRPAFIASVFYKDPMATLKWLEAAFGFELAHLLVDAEGKLAHSEMRYGDGVIMVGGEWADWVKSPVSVSGVNTQYLHVRLDEDIDAHCERALRAGAAIERPLADQFYGDRTYTAVDPDGHRWVFAQPVRQVSTAEMEAASGLTFAKTEAANG